MWFNEVVSFFRRKIDKSIDADMTTAILTYLKYPFGKYKNSDGANIYPISIIEGYFDTSFGRRRINDIIETIRYNKLTSEEIRQRQEKAIKEYKRPPKEIEKMWHEIDHDQENDYIQYIENNPPETSMRYVSDQYLDDDDVMYESTENDNIVFNNNWIFVTYGSDRFDRNRFERLRPNNLADHKHGFMFQKYTGGLWACPLTNNGWEKWCREEDFRVERLSSHFLFTLTENARIYVIDSQDDLIAASTLVDRFGIHYINYDELIKNGYDGLFVTDRAIWSIRDGLKHNDEYYEGLAIFDVESLCIFDPDVIVPVENNVINEEQLSDVDTKWEPKEGLFKSKSPKYIADYLSKHSKDIGQAIKRLTFYMNRVGKNIENKTVLNKAKSILQDRLEESVSENEYNTQEAINAVVDQGILLADDIEKTYYMDNGGFSICVIVKKTNSSYENNKVVYCFDNKKVLTPEPISNIYYLNKKSTAKEKFFLIKHIDRKYDSEHDNLLSENGLVFDGWAYIRDLYNGDFIVEPYDIKDEEYPFLWNMDGSYKMKDIIEIREFENNIDFLYMESDDGNKVLDKNYNVIIDSVESIDEDDVTLMYRKSHEYDRDGNIEEPVFVITVASKYGKSQNIYNYNMQLIFENIYTYDTKRIGDYIQMIYVRTDEGYNMVGKGGRRFFDKPAEKINNEFIPDVEMIDYVKRTDGKCNLILCDTLELYDEDWFDDIVYIDKEITGYDREYIVALKRNKNIYLIGLNDSEDSYLREILDEPVQSIYIIGEEQRILEIKKDGKYYLLLKNCKLLPVSRFGVEEHSEDESICYVEDENGKFDIINLSSGKSFCDKYLGGLRFDSISDRSSRYPIVESKGKYTYFDTDLFCLEFSERSIPQWYDKVEPAIYDEENDEYTFNVELNGEKRTISSAFSEEDE